MNMPPEQSGIKSRSFRALMVTQFLGAANDNAFKLVVTFLVLGKVIGGGLRETAAYMSAVGAVFVIPFLLFSTFAGDLADRFSKRTVIVWSKVGEIVVMALGVGALWYGNIWLCLAVLFFMGAQSTFFSPAKYGILPEMLPDEELSEGNGIMQMLTDIAIITGMIVGSFLFELFSDRPYNAGLAFVCVAVLGTGTSFFVGLLPPAARDRRIRWNFIREIYGNIRTVRRDRQLFLAIMGASFFWLVGACFQINFPVYGKSPDILNVSNEFVLGMLLALVALGVGLGAFLAGRLSGPKVEFGLVPIGAAMMAIFSMDLYFSWHSIGRTGVDLFLLGFGGGFYILPLATFVQQRAPADKKGMVLATNNFISFFAILLASGLYFIVGSVFNISPAGVFIILSLMVVIVASYIFTVLPDFLLRFCFWFLTHSVYRMRVMNPGRVPKHGGALLVCNHVSYVDALLVLASIQRFVRFVMFRRLYENRLVNWGCRILKVIPISEADGLRDMIRSIREATRAIRKGELVCIFAEGSITRIGTMTRFQRGFERIMKGLDAPIIPVHIDRMWGSIFSFRGGRILWKWPGLGGSKVTVSFGNVLPSTSTAAQVRQAVGELGAEAFRHRKADQVLLHQAFINSARSRPFRMAMADSSDGALTYGAMLTKTIALADRYRKRFAEEEMVGVVLPPSTAGSIANVALLLAGKVPVNLNFTAGDEGIERSMAQCRIKTVMTSRTFAQQVKLSIDPDRMLYTEELAETIGTWHSLWAALKAWLVPRFLLKRMYGRRGCSVDSLATVIFSSGATGEPKGVMLTHSNIMSNIESVDQVFDLDEHDRVCGVLPFFHAFGFTATLWFPLVKRISVVYHPDPLEGRAVGSLVRELGATVLPATPTFLRAYIRRVLPGDFGGLRYVVAGGEKLSGELAEQFRQRFGIQPVEGYGCTECSPVVSVNVPDFRSRGIVQIGTKRGTIGRPLPGVAVRIVDPETGAIVPPGKDGVLLVKGLSVMKGYLGRPDETAEVLRDGWYNTGDIATLDEDGFLTVTDRLGRFSKIDGEPVPHLHVEYAIADILAPATADKLDAAEPLFAVTGIPDEEKGEKLVVLHKQLPISVKELRERLQDAGLPDRYIPAADAFVQVSEMPILGTGKLNLKKLKAMAMSAMRTDRQDSKPSTNTI